MLVHQANIAMEIISDMFRWGVIDVDNKYAKLDLRTMSYRDAIETVCEMADTGLITSDIHNDSNQRYFVEKSLMAEFQIRKRELNTYD